jgi:cobalt-zinc-cadmium efflux system membrane fusion protein
MKARSLALAFSLVSACSRAQRPSVDNEDGSVPEPHSDEPPHEEMPKRVHLPSKVVTDAKIRVAPAERAVLDQVLTLPGEVSADPDKLARVASPASGRIERVDFREGTRIQRGDSLATIRVPDIGKAKADYTATQAKAAAARSNADRLEELAGRGLAANQEALAARAEADGLEAQARADAELLSAMGAHGGEVGSLLVLRAPIAGVVLSRDAVIGQPVTPDLVIATIADLSDVWFLARVFEKDLARLHVGASSEVRLNAYPKQSFVGTVEYVRQEVDPTARTLTARIRLKNDGDRLRVGLFGDAFVATGEKGSEAATIIVPREALTEVGGKAVVFVREADGDFELHDVTAGEGANGLVEILSGLREGELVVVDGTFTLKSVVLKSSFREEGE